MDITVTTSCGQIVGNEKKEYNEWLGVRYASAERFDDPKLVESWDGIYNAKKFGPRSLQYKGIFGHEENLVQQFYSDKCNDAADFDGYSEDSLNLNIFAPKNAHNCPVFFYIHGGGYSTGSNSDPDFITGSFAKAGIVTVCCNYRLAAFATANIDGCTGNYAVKDQIAALLWTYKNISAFGGNPEKITIGGESAGAYSVQNLLITPMIPEGIIKGAIMMSGAGDTRSLELLIKHETQTAIWNDVKKAANVDDINELKRMPAGDLYKLWTKEAVKHTGFYASPNVDGNVLPYGVKESIEKGMMKNVPLLLGMLSEDMWPRMLYNGIWDIATARTRQKGAPVYSYFFNCQVDKKYGAFHAADIPYAFNTIELRESTPSSKNTALRDDLFTSFCNFIKFGKPREDSKVPESKLAGPWLSMQESDNQFYEINGYEHRMCYPDTEKLDYQTENGQPFPLANEIK